MKKISKEDYKKNRIYGVIGLVALFLLGVFFGFIINGSDRVNKSSMTRGQCNDLQNQIMHMVNNIDYYDAQKLAQLDKMFSENCNNRDFGKNAVNSKPKPAVKEKLPDTTCGAIESLLKQELAEEDSISWGNHDNNARIYKKLAKRGCEKNRENYKKLALREREIADALEEENEINNFENNMENKSTCEEIENLLAERLNNGYDGDARVRVERAQVYANLSERGCPSNAQKYKELAKQELEIARALIDDDIDHNEREATEMVETYKRLQMQAEAAKMIEKAKKLTNPAIDFIIELEKIIEE